MRGRGWGVVGGYGGLGLVDICLYIGRFYGDAAGISWVCVDESI